MNLSEFREYRSDLMRKICENENIQRYLLNDGETITIPSDLIEKHVYPYEYIPGTTEEGKTFVSMLLAIHSVDNGMTSYECYMNLYITSYEGIMWVKNEDGQSVLRYDAIAEEIDRMLNGTRDLGFRVDLVGRKDGYQPARKFHGTMLTYCITAWNRKKQSYRTEYPDD